MDALRVAVQRHEAGARSGARRASRTSIGERIYAIHFEAKVPGGDYDFFIDDIAFICKG